MVASTELQPWYTAVVTSPIATGRSASYTPTCAFAAGTSSRTRKASPSVNRTPAKIGSPEASKPAITGTWMSVVRFTAAAVDRTTDIQVPVIAGFDASGLPIFAGVRFTDGDAFLVRDDVPAANAQVGVYDADLPVAIGDVTTAVYQGWSSVEATIAGQSYRFVVTHLAGQEVQDIQLAQTEQLLGLLAGESRPTILVGDFNSGAYGADPRRATPTYGMVLRGGFADSWKAPDREAPGLTCCERADLLNPQQTFDQRIDFVFTRNLPDGEVDA